MQKKYIVRLTDAERDTLGEVLKMRRVASQKVRRARILLKADADGPNWADKKIAEAFDCTRQAVECIRERLVTEGFEITLEGKPKGRVRGKVLDGEQDRVQTVFLGEVHRDAEGFRSAGVRAGFRPSGGGSGRAGGCVGDCGVGQSRDPSPDA